MAELQRGRVFRSYTQFGRLFPGYFFIGQAGFHVAAYRSIPLTGPDALARGTLLQKQIVVPVSHEHTFGPELE